MRSFADYDQDLAHFMREIVLPDCQPPYVALAHSMGGNILLRNASLSGSWFSRMVLSAPMIDIAPDKLGAPHARLARLRRDAWRPSASAPCTRAAAATSRSSSSPSRATRSPPTASAISATG